MKSDKLVELVSCGEISLEERGLDLNRPEGLESFEEMALLYGPQLFLWMVSRYNLKLDVEKVARVSHATMSRWLNAEAGKVFGQRHDVRSYRSIWFGYPSPFPGFDRIVEEMYGGSDSFVSIIVDKYGLKVARRWMKQRVGFGLEMLDVPSPDIFAAAERAGIPYPTTRRWMAGRAYPSQWSALDLISSDLLGVSWIEALIYVRPSSLPRRVPQEALRRMVEESLIPPS